MSSLPTLTAWLKAAGEPSRLRLLALCAHRDFSVTDLADALRQSEPRVSRHLRILCEAGLLGRVRQGQWVHYRLAAEPAAAAFVRGVLAQVDRRDSQVVEDRRRAESAVASSGTAATPGESRLGRALAAFVASTAVGGTDDDTGRLAEGRRTLLVGVGHLELLEALSHPGSPGVAVASGRRAAQAARAFAAARGLRLRVETAAAADALPDGPFDAIVLDRLDAAGGSPGQAIDAARRRLAPDGGLWLFERYEALEEARDRVVQHPLARVRTLLQVAGLDCRRLNPIEADGELVLAAFARPASVPAANPNSLKGIAS